MKLQQGRRLAGSAPGRWWAMASLALLSGCTILAPIQTSPTDRRFALNKDAGEQKNVPCRPVNPDAPGECSPLDQDIDAFHGGLGRVIWETDVRRRQLLAQAADHTNMNSAYNALLWPLGAYVIERKIRQPGWRTLDVAALATASYGFLSSGIPDRDQLYVKTAARMACVITLFDADLYPKSEIRPARFDADVHDAEAPPRDRDDPAWLRHKISNDTFIERLDELSVAAQTFASRRDDVLLDLKLETPKAAPTGTTPADRARLAAKGLTGVAKTPKDPSKEFIFDADSLMTRAQEQLAAARKLKQQLDDAGNRMRRERMAVEAALTQGLNERTPALQQPASVATQIAKAFEAGMTSERKFTARVRQEAGTARSEDWVPTPAVLADLTEASRKAVVTFWKQDRARLKQAMGQVGEWMARHEERARQARVDASSMGCSDGDLAEFTRSLSKAAEGAGPSAPAPSPSGAGK